MVADFAQRQAQVRALIEAEAAKLKGKARITDELLAEVTALVEWPVVISGRMDERFMQLPPEVIIATIEHNQRYFPVFSVGAASAATVAAKAAPTGTALTSFFRCLALLALFAPATALAERYRVDLILFADRSAAAGESSQPLLLPEAGKTLEPWEAAPLRAAGIEILPDESFGLTEEWNRLRNSRNHEPLVRIAWIQKDPPAERTVALRLRHGTPVTGMTATGSTEVYPVDGWVALLAGRYLHLDANFVQTQALEAGDLRSFRLRERRRLKRDELNHLDSPRLGVLVRAQHADQKKK